MRIRRLLTAASALIAAALTVAVCLYPAFAARWADSVSRPALRALTRLTEHLPFALLEWGLLALALMMFGAACFCWGRRGLRSALARLAQRAVGVVVAAAIAFSALWLPLYHGSVQPTCAATDAQLSAVCENLIADLNGAALDFSRTPADLPAKVIAFPFWMRAFNITGLFSFPTGEALVSPELPDCALPFVAVHERMHARGFAGEGAANIAAWEDCMERGGLYANSARIWALKYTMDALRDRDSAAYAECRQLMNETTAENYRAIGGGTRIRAINPGVQSAFAALGVGEAASDYEILAFYLASQTAV